jgi:uncharacterized membrane protein YeaQ/YmgE (transglycosylase-associated protein family)
LVVYRPLMGGRLEIPGNCRCGRLTGSRIILVDLHVAYPGAIFPRGAAWGLQSRASSNEVGILIQGEFEMVAFLWWIIIGLAAGLLARLLVPGPQPMGLIYTTVLGMVGALVGGFLSSQLFGYSPNDPRIHAEGLFIATGGAMLLLVIFANISRRPGSQNPRI